MVAPSCTGLTTSGVLADLRDSLAIPVVDPVLAMAAMANVALTPAATVPE